MLRRKTSFCSKCGETIDGRAIACQRCGSKRVQTFLSSAHLELIDHLRREMNYGPDKVTTEDASEETSAAGTKFEKPSAPHMEADPQ
jgi:hypothetical protein